MRHVNLFCLHSTMPSTLSKSLSRSLLMSDWSFGYNCYEVGHTWTPSCTDAALDIALTVFNQAIRMYGGLYILSHLVFSRKKGQLTDAETLKSVLLSILRSSLFLGFNAYTMIGGFCLTRKLSGRFYYVLCATLPAFVGSLLAIQIERENRRPALAFYCANIASECLFRIAVSRGYLKSLPYGEIMLFTLSISILLYMIRKNGFGSDPVSLVLRFFIGKGETNRELEKKSSESCSGNCGGDNSSTTWYPAKKVTCAHDESCLQYTLMGFLRPFLLGTVGQGILSSVLRSRTFLNKSFQKILQALLHNFTSSRSLRFGLFLGSFCGIYKGVNCLLRSQECDPQSLILPGQGDTPWKDWHSVVAASLASFSMLLSPNSTISLYLVWKTIETVYFQGVKGGYLKFPNETLCTLYAVSVMIIFYTGVLEPSKLRGSYMKFIDRITHHRLHLINRNLLDVFGTGASDGYEEYVPDVVTDWTSHTFMETIFVWLI